MCKTLLSVLFLVASYEEKIAILERRIRKKLRLLGQNRLKFGKRLIKIMAPAMDSRVRSLRLYKLYKACCEEVKKEISRFHCDYCKNGFEKKEQLEEHIRSHMSNRYLFIGYCN